MVDPVAQHVAAAVGAASLPRQDACRGGQCAPRRPRDAAGLLSEPGAGDSFEIGIDRSS